MTGQIFRAVSLTLLIGALLPSAASKTSEQNAEADFTATIPKAGLQGNVEKVFFLGPSNTLQVIDQTGAAVYLPEKSDNTQQSSSKPYSVAYRFENGACDFTKTVDFKDIFPDYTTAVWDKQQKDSETSGGGSAEKVVKYRFTNPPAEYLGEGLSFCVRFKTVLAPKTDSGTSTSTVATQASTSGSTQPSSTSSDASQLQTPNSTSPPAQTEQQDTGHEENEKVLGSVAHIHEGSGDTHEVSSQVSGTLSGEEHPPAPKNELAPPEESDIPKKHPVLQTAEENSRGEPQTHTSSQTEPSSQPAQDSEKVTSEVPDNEVQSNQTDNGKLPTDEAELGEFLKPKPASPPSEKVPSPSEKEPSTEQEQGSMSKDEEEKAKEDDLQKESHENTLENDVETPHAPVSKEPAHETNEEVEKAPAAPADQKDLPAAAQPAVSGDKVNSNQGSDDTRQEKSEVTKEDGTSKKDGEQLESDKEEVPGELVAPQPVGSQVAEDPSHIVADPTSTKEHEDVDNVKQEVQEEDIKEASNEQTTHSSVEPAEGTGYEADASEAGKLAEAPAVPGAEEQPSTVPHPAVSDDGVSLNQTNEGSGTENGQITEAEHASKEEEKGLARGAGDEAGAPARRLTENTEEKVAYLTVIVHSAAWGFASGISILSVFFFAAAATLLPASS
ncbi:Toxoplasma gondii family A protein [Toxoplasma gondii VEG]|uniref:SUSA family n=1 Tax=Toxoplasma gondii (strain ATCC 50861 / VEG) TaxID=432359 RepID=B9QMX3_TOXGV|nr:Toxoplasma gondii family A protein [Toxoplasma gondii VEG]CEL78781.1 TPA: SUSA family [Toxoplasma gondii VEG]